MGRWLGIDYGLRRIGLAIGDEQTSVTAGLRTIPAEKTASRNAEQIADIAKKEDANGIVVGLPLLMDGSDSPQTRLSRIFHAQLVERCDIPVALHDERLSSFQADLDLVDTGFSRKKRAALRDTLAARRILQSFFDTRRQETDIGMGPQEC
ncbi:MAG: Holliday junction resolvase RuvX [Phycisphaerae bacterium]